MSNSFGFGGHNATVILRAYRPDRRGLALAIPMPRAWNPPSTWIISPVVNGAQSLSRKHTIRPPESSR